MPREQEASDGELLLRLERGDEAAFTALYRRHQGAVYRFALQMTGKTGLAEDATQEVFLVVMKGGHGYDPAKGAFGAFLYGVARHVVLRALRRERPYAAGLGEAAEWWDGAASSEEALAKAQEATALRGAILELPARYREVVVLCELHELGYAEAAVVMGCPVGTVRSRLHRARALLAGRMRAAGRCAV